MKNLIKIVLSAFSIILFFSSGITGKNLRFNLPVNSVLAESDDTPKFVRLIRIDSFKLQILPPSSGIQFYKDKIVFLSMSKNENRLSVNQISFGAVEAYYAAVYDSVTGVHTIFSPSSSFTSPCEAMTFSHDYKIICYSKLSKKENKEKIFMAEFTSKDKNQAGWVMEKSPLDFCTGNYNYSHPTMSSNDELLIFASDNGNSYGGMDLFLSRKSGGKWTSPENLGRSINTAGNEFFPFLDADNNLYFSSDSLPGYGGYDLFTCKFNGKGWARPVNLTYRVNSVYDDIAFTINRLDGKTAFFTRRKSLRAYEMQLFRVSLKEDTTIQNIVTISDVFNGNPVLKTSLAASNSVAEQKSVDSKAVKTKPETELINKKAIKSPDLKASLKKTETKDPGKKSPAKISLPEAKPEVSKTTKPGPSEKKDVVVYRVQLLPGANQKNSKEIVINGTGYKLYEYIYLGAKRYAIGEFSTLASATALQRICRQSGYPDAFVVVFKNNARSMDLNLFR